VTTSDAALESFLKALREDDPQRLYDLAPCGYLSTTPDGVIVKVNRTFLTMCGYRAEELLRRHRFDELLSIGGRIYHETHFAPMLRMQGAVKEIALDLACADGTRRAVLVNAVVDNDENGLPAAVRIAVFDATHRRAYELELLQAKRRAEESDARARALSVTLQQTLIPPAPPVIPGLDVAGEFLAGDAHAEVGGDFYDVFQVAADDWVLVIGDVCGRGAEAAVITALARFTIRAEAMQHEHPSAVLTVLNRVLLAYHSRRFCTVALVRLRRSDTGWVGSVACGGHPLPLARRHDGTVEQVGRPGTVLGVVPEPALHDSPIKLADGDTLVLFTDGIVEARRGEEFFDEQRTEAAVAAAPASATAVTTGLVREVLAFAGQPRRDDIAVLAATAVPAPASS
jgi:sigma-B regulation protein RsbU (phosphoserine phosphatase)